MADATKLIPNSSGCDSAGRSICYILVVLRGYDFFFMFLRGMCEVLRYWGDTNGIWVELSCKHNLLLCSSSYLLTGHLLYLWEYMSLQNKSYWLCSLRISVLLLTWYDEILILLHVNWIIVSPTTQFLFGLHYLKTRATLS